MCVCVYVFAATDAPVLFLRVLRLLAVMTIALHAMACAWFAATCGFDARCHSSSWLAMDDATTPVSAGLLWPLGQPQPTCIVLPRYSVVLCPAWPCSIVLLFPRRGALDHLNVSIHRHSLTQTPTR